MPKYSTPMMQQYDSFKQEYPDCMILFRLGDFYELFEEDALRGAEILDITLTARPEGKDGKIPMAGVPYHAIDSYIAKLVKHGHKVALCEQVGEIPKYGIVKREITRIITPGTVLDEKSLERKEHNYIITLELQTTLASIAAIDITTGECVVGEWNEENIMQRISNEITKLNPSECILSPESYQNNQINKLISQISDAKIFAYNDWDQNTNNAKHILQTHFKENIASLQKITNQQLSQQTLSALIAYLNYTQRNQTQHINEISLISDDQYLQLDTSTVLNLELFTTIRDRDHKGSLISVIDYTHTAMGGRKLKQWLARPSKQIDEIRNRHNAISTLISESFIHQELQKKLKSITDLERLLSRLSMGVGNARDIVNLKLACYQILETKQLLKNLQNPWLQQKCDLIASDITALILMIEDMLLDEPGLDVRNGQMIKRGVQKDLDELHSIINDSREWLTQLEEQEKEKTGITTLKIKYNQVFGFYLEISKSHIHKVPSHYMRKQTLVNGERFITKELKEKEEIILNAEEKMKDIEYELFQKVLAQVLEYTIPLQKAANSIAEIDCIAGFAQIAIEHKYTKPEMHQGFQLEINQGRHAVVEQLLPPGTFVPNNTTFNTQSLFMLTGPNMAGKSVYMRQIALVVLLAHIGSFVPVKDSKIPITDAIFVRSGASDVITSGLSTFMVEMVETAYILKNATQNSLIIMDEIGRGTSTQDGMAIAQSVARYIVENIKAKTLFATHYHELANMEENYIDDIKNYHMEVELHQNEPIFLHTLKQGPTEHSYGISVAKKAGLPQEAIQNAINHTQTYSKLSNQTIQERPIINKKQAQESTGHPQLMLFEPSNKSYETIKNELKNTDISNTTPIQALIILNKLKEASNLDK